MPSIREQILNRIHAVTLNGIADVPAGRIYFLSAWSRERIYDEF